MKTLVDIFRNRAGHWVVDGFPVRSLFSYHGDTKAISPFLLFDYAGPYLFGPNAGQPRGVGEHPHRGFETVTIVYDGEVSHRDSTGDGGMKDKLLTPQNCVVVLIDYQPEQVTTVQSSPVEQVMLDVKAVCKLARAYDVPVVLSTVGVDLGVNTGTIEELRAELPDVPDIDRTGVNSWEDPDFRAAVEASGRKKIVMCGLWTEVCLAFPTLDMLAEGYEVYPVIDAVGGISKVSHESAIQRMIQAGAHPVTAIPFGCELMRNWARTDSENLRKVMRWYFPASVSLPRVTAAESSTYATTRNASLLDSTPLRPTHFSTIA